MHANLYDCLTADEFGEESTDVDSAHGQNLIDRKFFNDLAQKQYERAKARLTDALNWIEVVTQETEVSFFALVGRSYALLCISCKHIVCLPIPIGSTVRCETEAA